MRLREQRPIVILGAQRFDRTAALVDGLLPTGRIWVIHVPPARPVVPGLLAGLFDAGEIPLAQYIFARDQGDPLTAIPVFPDRIFVQQYVYVRRDSDIASPGDLRGKRVWVPGYLYTACFWHRAMLQEHGVQPHEVLWFAGGPEIDPRMRHPDGVQVKPLPSQQMGIDLLLAGEVDCVMHEATPVVPPGQEARVRRLFPDVHALQRDAYRRTGFFPIVHIIAVRQEALESWPELGVELCRLYDQAKAVAYRLLQNERLTSLPLMRVYLDETMTLFGDDPWPYGLERNRQELETTLRLTFEQGLTRRQLSLDELFDPRSLQYTFQARMSSGAPPWSGGFPASDI
jgi:4,5-dihydroxyphthalate decarboxylase